MTNEDFAKKIKDIRTRQDMSIEELAERSGVKQEVLEAMEAGEIDKKDGLKILTDISTKLNDKFSVKEEQVEQVVIVQAKYDDVCPSCGREVSRKPLSKEDAMEMYDLIEKY